MPLRASPEPQASRQQPSGWVPLSEFLARPAAPSPPEAGRVQISRLFNRDLTWLRFNDRVLAEAADPGVPPLERLRFATIVSSNLDEFFMVRVAGVARVARRTPLRRFPDGLTAGQVLAQIREQALRQKALQAEVLEDIFKDLADHGIHIHADFIGDHRLDRELRPRLPEADIILRRSLETVPFLTSGRIHVFVRFPREYAVISIREREARLVALPPRGKAQRYVLAERWLADRAQDLFPGREVIEAFPFKIIREADLRYRPDDEETLEEQIVDAVERRSQAKVIRLEVDAPSYTEGALYLAAALRLDSAALYRFDLPLDLRTLARVATAPARRGLRYPPVRPQTLAAFRRRRGIFDAIRCKDFLLHHPYDSFGSVENFLWEAARDPHVRRIYHTVYRTSRDSPVLEALREAASRGKNVTAYVEIKARFDELNNVRWAAELRRSGVRVVRPLGGLKVHSKLTQVLRREASGDVYYLHLGTGNYHPTTARQYTDLSLLTADQELGREISSYFAAIMRRQPPVGLRHILVAPTGLHSGLLRLVREEARIQRHGGRGYIAAKMNSLVDPVIISALYDASCAGVRIELLVRGICCLRPGIKGLSENIRVVSVVDRFLEHSRIYYFRAAGEEKLYLSSADWMPRNFFTRFELAFPVRDPRLKRYIRDVILGKGLADNVKAWALHPDGTYERVPQARGRPPVRSQFLFESMARNQYRDTILAGR